MTRTTTKDLDLIISRMRAKDETPGQEQGIRPGHYVRFIGIDTGVETGFAIWSPVERILTICVTAKIHKALVMLKNAAETFGYDRIYVRIEDARQRKFIPKQKNESRERGRREGAGYVKRDAVIWEDFLTDLGIHHQMVAPKYNKTKLDAKAFQKLTGWDKPTSDHARDAAMLVYGL